jgi:hypothetical protein
VSEIRCLIQHRPATRHHSHKAEDKCNELDKRGLTTDAENLRTLCACGRAATRWQLANIAKGVTADLQKCYILLQEEGHQLPKANQLRFSSKVALDCAGAARWTEFVALFSLKLPESQSGWISDPVFGALLPSRNQAEELKEFWSIYNSTVVNDCIVALVKDCGTDSEKRTTLIDLATSFIQKCRANEKDLPEYAIQGTQPALQFFKGIIGLLLPYPGHLGSSASDVTFLRSDDKSQAAIVEVFGESGKAIARRLRTDEFWKRCVLELARVM